MVIISIIIIIIISSGSSSSSSSSSSGSSIDIIIIIVIIIIISIIIIIQRTRAGVRGEFHEPGFRHFVCAVFAPIRRLCKSEPYVWSFYRGGNVSLSESPRFSAKLPDKMCRRISKSWLAKFPRGARPYARAHARAWVHASANERMRLRMNARLCAPMHPCLHASMRPRVDASMRLCICEPTNLCICASVHLCIYHIICMHARTHDTRPAFWGTRRSHRILLYSRNASSPTHVRTPCRCP